MFRVARLWVPHRVAHSPDHVGGGPSLGHQFRFDSWSSAASLLSGLRKMLARVYLYGGEGNRARMN